MNATSRAILQTLLASDDSLSQPERQAIKNLMEGVRDRSNEAQTPDETPLVTQKEAAKLLSVNRVTIYRMTRDCMLHPVEILPGTWRYPLHEITRLARCGIAQSNSSAGHPIAAIASAA
jgi:predicted DNA-binding transcriptional regulator AlpA